MSEDLTTYNSTGDEWSTDAGNIIENANAARKHFEAIEANRPRTAEEAIARGYPLVEAMGKLWVIDPGAWHRLDDMTCVYRAMERTENHDERPVSAVRSATGDTAVG
jgi:hypothetical protein